MVTPTLKSAVVALVVFLLLAAGGVLLQQPEQNRSTPTASPPSPVSKHHATAGDEHTVFASYSKLVQHYRKHGHEFGNISQEEYLRQAVALRDAEVGGEVLEYVRADSIITRYARSSGAFIAFTPDGTIRTYFKPTHGEAYFYRQAKRR